tara:strand:+ start:1309 stop:1455 length:147 start_codon:yes stop_codon:yes gene_type:complete
MNKKLKDITTEISKLNIKEQRQIAIIILASVLSDESLKEVLDIVDYEG